MPDGWYECELGEIAKIVTDFVASGSFASLRENVKYYDSPNHAILVRTKDFSNNFEKDLVYTDKHGYTFLSNSNLYGGELILPNIGASIGKVFIMPKLEHLTTLAPNSIMVRCWDEITLKWLYYFFCSGIGQNALKEISSSTAQGKFNKTDFKGISIPIPPLKEQTKVIKLISFIEDILQLLESERSNLDKNITLAKAKILDLAMQGKLVPQDPADEPAADMLCRINPKAKIITDNPHSRNIPNGWCWVMVSDVFAPMKRKLPEGDNFWYIDIDSVDNKRNVAYPKNICTATAPSRASRFTQKGDVVFSMVRPYLRNIALVPADDCIASTGFYVFHPLDAIFSKYSYLLTLSSFFVDGLNSYMKGDNSPSINKDNVESFVIPLPPINEQKRIVAKIEELYYVLDKIEASLQS